MGIISHIVLKISKNSEFDKKYVIWNLSLIVILGHSSWLINIVNLYFNLDIEILALTLRIIIALVIFLLLVIWCFSLYKSEIQLETTVLFVIGYIITMFLGLFILFLLSLINSNIEMLFYYFVVHIVFFALFAGFYLYFSKIFGFYYSEFLGVLQFWFFFRI
jgi:cytochrome c oxidase subunit 1